MRIEIKPLSVNKAWSGRRHKSTYYMEYQRLVHGKLPFDFEVPDGELELNLVFGYSSKQSDIDNGVKPFVDILQKHYGFNDNRIYRMTLEKTIVPKGSEYIDFTVKSLDSGV